MKRRVGAIIVKDSRLLLIKRIRDGEQYYTTPGGTVEEGETLQQALKRELAEELGIEPTLGKIIYTYSTPGKTQHFFEISSFTGEPTLGGPEKERMTETNQYILEWVDLEDLPNEETLKPAGLKERISVLFSKNT